MCRYPTYWSRKVTKVQQQQQQVEDSVPNVPLSALLSPSYIIRTFPLSTSTPPPHPGPVDFCIFGAPHVKTYRPHRSATATVLQRAAREIHNESKGKNKNNVGQLLTHPARFRGA